MTIANRISAKELSHHLINKLGELPAHVVPEISAGNCLGSILKFIQKLLFMSLLTMVPGHFYQKSGKNSGMTCSCNTSHT